MSPLRLIRMSDITPTRPPWPHFPHCPNPTCNRRLWAATTYRHPDDPREPLTGPTPDGHCPHCGSNLA